MDVSNYSTISENDDFQYVNFRLSLTMFSQMAISLGTKFQVGTINKGFITGNIQYNSKLSSNKNIFENYESDKKPPAVLLHGTYSYPILKRQGTGKVKIPLGVTGNGYQAAYTIDNSSPFIQSYFIEGGISYTELSINSDLFAIKKQNESNSAYFANGFPSGTAIIRQGAVSAYLGLRVSHFINTHISGSDENRSFNGTKKEEWDVHIGLKSSLLICPCD